MQTFLPYPSFRKSAAILDSKRLGKQRVECLQLIRGQWINHPASKMWRGYEWSLGLYGLCICEEWQSRGYKDTCREKIEIELLKFPYSSSPPWLGNELFHAAHRSALKRKLPEYYSRFFPFEPDDLPYVWPV